RAAARRAPRAIAAAPAVRRPRPRARARAAAAEGGGAEMKTRTVVPAFVGLLAAGLAFGCASSSGDASTGEGFDSAEHAVDALVAALRGNDQPKLHAILGAGADEILDSGDAVADQNGRTEFLSLYDESHKLVPAADGGMTLVVGSSEWPMPIPVVSND